MVLFPFFMCTLPINICLIHKANKAWCQDYSLALKHTPFSKQEVPLSHHIRPCYRRISTLGLNVFPNHWKQLSPSVLKTCMLLFCVLIFCLLRVSWGRRENKVWRVREKDRGRGWGKKGHTSVPARGVKSQELGLPSILRLQACFKWFCTLSIVGSLSQFVFVVVLAIQPRAWYRSNLSLSLN